MGGGGGEPEPSPPSTGATRTKALRWEGGEVVLCPESSPRGWSVGCGGVGAGQEEEAGRWGPLKALASWS